MNLSSNMFSGKKTEMNVSWMELMDNRFHKFLLFAFVELTLFTIIDECISWIFLCDFLPSFLRSSNMFFFWDF